MKRNQRPALAIISVVAVASAGLAAVWPGAAPRIIAHRPVAHRPVDHRPQDTSAVRSSGALAAASTFAVAWWSSDWREVAQARAERLRPLLVPAEAGSLTTPRQVPVLDEAQARARRQVAVGVPSVVVADRSPVGVGVAVTAPITVTTAAAPPAHSRLAMEVLMVPGAGRWLVAEVDE